jgi:flagellar hook assembly protein FlgD
MHLFDYYRIYSLTGQLVRTLSLGRKDAGDYLNKEKAAYWDGRNSNGEEVSSGVYFYVMEVGSLRATKRMVILR